MEIKAKLTELFLRLRRRNLIAKQNFECCSTCASAALDDLIVEREALGGVYYHRQNAQNLTHLKGTWLGYCVHMAKGESDESTDTRCKEVGTIVVDEAKKVGLIVEWNDDPSTKIWVGIGESPK